jgi:hypothetical protein
MAIKSNDKISPAEKTVAGMAMARNEGGEIFGPKFSADVECVSPEGAQWKDRWNNAVQLQGKIDLMNRYFGTNTGVGGLYNTWYVGLHSINATNNVAANMGAWVSAEVGGYGTSRLAFTNTAPFTTQSSTWSLSYAFTTNTYTVSGLAVCNYQGSATGNSTAGIIYSMGVFNAGSRQVMQADTLNVTLTLSMQ